MGFEVFEVLRAIVHVRWPLGRRAQLHSALACPPGFGMLLFEGCSLFVSSVYRQDRATPNAQCGGQKELARGKAETARAAQPTSKPNRHPVECNRS